MKTKDISQIPLFSALIAVTAWIAVPTSPPFTMQTLGVLFSLAMLGGKKGSLAVLLYIALGAVGLPVFSCGTGGLSVLFGPTGGYIFGFIFTALFACAADAVERKTDIRLPSVFVMTVSVIIIYTSGILWRALIFSDGGVSAVASLILTDILPFILPDTVKIFLADHLTKRLRRYIK